MAATPSPLLASRFNILSSVRCWVSTRRVHGAVDDFIHALGLRTVSATVELAFVLRAVANDLAAAVLARRRQLVSRAFEAVERVSPAGHDHLEGARVIVPANVAFGHRSSSRVCVL